MKKHALPNLGSLRAFEAAARLGNFSEAAATLHVTHGAVSHQIRGLETELGVQLFVRHGKRVELNEVGRRYAEAVRAAFDKVIEATAAVRREARDGRLVVSVLPSFAARWLMPRLGSFIEHHPDIDLELRASADLVNFSHEDVDIGLRRGMGVYPGLHSERLLGDSIFAACSPAFNGARLPAEPSELLTLPLLLSSGDEPWRAYFDAVGLKDAPEPERGIRYLDSAHLLEAAIASQGIALVRRSLAHDPLQQGRLVRLFGVEVPITYAYYFVCPPHRLASARVQAFRQWLLAEVERFESDPGQIMPEAARERPDPVDAARIAGRQEATSQAGIKERT